MRENFFTLRWNKLPKEAVDSPSVVIFETHLNMILGNVLYVKVLELDDPKWSFSTLTIL